MEARDIGRRVLWSALIGGAVLVASWAGLRAWDAFHGYLHARMESGEVGR